MKRLNYILLCLMTMYLAGMYRYLPLMVLAVLEFSFLAVSYGLSKYFRRNLAVKALRHSDSVQEGTALPCGVEVCNTGKLPVTRFRIRVLYGYVPGSKQEKKYIYSNSECGVDVLHYEVNGMFCGMMYLRMDRLQVYDYLTIFSAKKKLREEIKIAVFPRERALQIELPSLCCRENELPREFAAAGGAEARNEVRQLREYQVDDSKRYIHWNQSARMERLMVKEYEKESDARVLLYLDLEGMDKAGIEEKSTFYELLSAVVLGLLKIAPVVRVFWYDSQRKQMVNQDAANMGQCQDVLFALYQMEWLPEEEMDQIGVGGTDGAGEDMFRGCFQLDLNLRWYWEKVLIYQFSATKVFYDEIAHKIFVV